MVPDWLMSAGRHSLDLLLKHAIRVAQARPRRERGLVAWLQRTGNLCRWGDGPPVFSLAAPEGLQLELHLLSFCQLYYVEDLERVARGLRRMVSRTPLQPFDMFDRFRANDEWFAKLLSATSGGGMAPIGRVSLSASGADLRWADKASVSVIQLTGSLVSVTVRVEPTPDLQARLSRVLQEEPKSRSDLAWSLNLRRRRWLSVWGSTPAGWIVRQRELAYLYDRVRSEVSSVLEHRLGPGCIEDTRLPTMPIFLLRNGSWSDADHQYWQSVGMNPNHPEPYSSRGWAICRANGPGSGRSLPHWQVLIEEKNAIGAKVYPSEFRRKEALYIAAEHKPEELVTSLGLLAHGEALSEGVTRVRRGVATRLARRVRRIPWLFGWRRSFRLMAKLNVLDFDASRFDSELAQWRAGPNFRHALEEFGRPKVSAEEEPTLLADFDWLLDRRMSYTREQVSLLRRSFQEALNSRLQARLFWLTVVGIALAVIGALSLLSETTRRDMWRWILSVFGA